MDRIAEVVIYYQSFLAGPASHIFLVVVLGSSFEVV